VVQIAGDVQHSGMVDVLIDGETLSMFMQDIEARGEFIGYAASARN